jgi:hypothetical protein
MHALKSCARNICACSVAAASLAGSIANAAIVINSDPAAGGIGYRNQIILDVEDSASFTRHVGGWSWEDNSLFDSGEDPVGWTHTSDWTALTLTGTTALTIRMEREAGVPWPSSTEPNRVASIDAINPSFTLYRGWDNDLMPQAFADQFNGGVLLGDWHNYNNDGDIAWAEDLSYVGHVSNSTEAFAEITFANLPAGQYTLVLGSNAPSNEANRQGYRATFTTVPEPATTLFIGAGAVALIARRRRNSQYSA